MHLSRIADDMSGGEAVNAVRLPKHLRLSNAVLKLIEFGGIRPGNKLPLESAMAGALPASRSSL